ncbi:DUF5054 domain-containing protein [Gracilibacillus alcaliphilus]|uniref:DUF5054 domain-containing protein n=1 Tax=Gracilibacillus alcaliphilus TaxID=1401441 RepID=UPI00195D3889|nr:DUF5054 domain-containing protein [Gracilibacillus alcaliphilus]MBM7678011.1 hypothetical protein [Gracilibacillus alcaliphilus]
MKTLHVVFKTHLDIGFTDLAEKVMDQYLYDFIPRAVAIGKALPDQFTWTTGSWLIAHYFNHPSVSTEAKEQLAAAIESGTIKWHGLSVTTHTELMDRELFTYGLSISQGLDDRFQQETIAAKMTDVPGHTIAMVPLMAKAGLKYLHIGVNASSAVPNVPELFVWRTQDGSEIVVHYAKDYGQTFAREGWDDMLYFAHSHDNQGPPADAEEVLALHQQLKQQYPDAEIRASSLDAFAAAAWAKKDTLPVIEEEIADTWIHGIGSAPAKISKYQLLLHLRDKWLEEGSLLRDSASYRQFSEQLLLVAEHTWGGNGNVFLPDYRNYLIDDFQQARAKDKLTFNHSQTNKDFFDLMTSISTNIDDPEQAHKRSYKLYEATWKEQDNYVKKAVASLPTELQQQAKQAFSDWEADILPLAETAQPVTAGQMYQFGDIELAFSATGALQVLNVKQRSLLEEGKKFGELSYQRFDFADFSQFLSKYSRLTRWTSSWALVDFAKRGIEAYADIRHELLFPYVKQSSLKQHDQQVTISFDLAFKEAAVHNYGLPKQIRLNYLLDLEKQTLQGELRMKEKIANRMPEAYWLETTLSVANPYRWQMYKLNQPLSPYHVVENGNRNMHALSKEGLTYTGIEGKLSLRSLEAPLFSFGRRSLLLFDNAQPSLNEGIYINLFNNVWGTNFPAWYEGDMCYRFEADLQVY